MTGWPPCSFLTGGSVSSGTLIACVQAAGPFEVDPTSCAARAFFVAFPFAVRRKSLRMLVMLNPPVLRVLRNLLVNFVLVLTPFLPALHEPLSHFV